ncbi:MAG: hypothetical protein B5M53_03605, partial [Candidatus Cloacimonas sp. 4484_209]
LGRTNIILFCTLISALSNIILNLLLIPKYGLAGAAGASAFSLALANILLSGFIFRFSTIHPFSKDYLKPVGITFIISLLLFKLDLNIFLIITLISFLALISIFFTKSVDHEDILLIEALETKVFKQNALSNKLATWCGVK